VAQLGYLGIRYPEEYGGTGGCNIMFTILCGELARGGMCLAVSVAMQRLMGTTFIHRFGSEDQKQRLLVPAIRGTKLGVIAMTESGAGSDLGAISTTARGDGDGFVLNGSKMWVTNASLADFFTVAAETDREAGFKGIDILLVERERPGVNIGKDIAKMGVRGLGTGELILEDCRVPQENLLGEEGTGFPNVRRFAS
jgi:alkylation response protein AidB-like acyl-CoA dehydrogenase